ncbi:MAG TPA: serine/threonine-protein kinase [Candidatus Saccharimonadales bacterium]|nr:serine/threonine-protein kinase [Candidatus Saccharimonadales bacterium]
MPSPQNREEALFALALEQPADKRAAFLDIVCAADPALRQRLAALLAAHEAPDPLLPEPASVATIKLDLPEAPDEAIGERIGRYKILEKVGEGGCGVVYVAEQTEPVRRRVALKVIKLGMDTKAVVARFEAERQALAMMDHPNIAKVLDAGTTEQGRPYFVMELVRGIRITDYCDQNNLSTKERLDLFIKVCQAIQHAHQKGIIHRDIKPSNILVTLHDGIPVPKVIDFGIAKATEGRLTDATVYTQLHQFIGTPAYMSPEQAEMSGLDIDTRSDIYSLGVLLYELLTGSTPFDANELMSQGIDQMRKTIREKEPVRPSTRFATLKGEDLTTTAKRRSTDSSKLMHQLKGDLDWIVMKCLEKNRTRRYETANGLAFDLKRHLDSEPVLARPPSTAYKFQKAFRRNKLVFAAAAAVFVALCLGIIATTLQSVRATRAKQEALAAQASESQQRQKAEAAQAGETKLRQQAQAAELAARQRAYASDMNVAKQALDGNNLGRALDLLTRQVPLTGQQDLRGWEWRYLWRQTRSDALFTLCEKSDEIESLAASPDGRWLAVGVYHKDGLFVYDLQTRRQVAQLAPGEGKVRAAFSPADSLVAFTSAGLLASGENQDKYTLHLWNVATRQMAAELPLDDECDEVQFSQDGQRLVTSTYRGHITLWQMPTGAKLASYPSEQDGNVGTDFAATPDLSLAAYTMRINQIRLVDLRTGKELWAAVGAKERVLTLAFSPDGKTLASSAGFTESDIHLWDVATGKEVGRLEGHSSSVRGMVFWPDGKKLASCSADQTIRIWDLASRKCLDVLRGHRQEVWRLLLLPDHKTLVSGCKDGTVCLWDASVAHSKHPRITIPQTVRAWQFTPDSRAVLTLSSLGEVSRWTGEDFQQPETLLNIGTILPPGHRRHQFSQDGRLLAVAGRQNGVSQVWDVSRRMLWRQWTNKNDSVELGFLSDGHKLVTESDSDKMMHEFSLTTGSEIASWHSPESFADAAFSPDERLCVAIGYRGDFTVRNLADESSKTLDLHVLEGVGVAFSPDGRLMVAASELGLGRVWDTATWKPEVTLGGFLLGAHSVAFSPDGKRLAIGSNGKEALKLWNTASWQEVITLQGEGSLFWRTAFSADGNVLGSLNANGTLYLWRAPSLAEINAAEAKEKAEAILPR